MKSIAKHNTTISPSNFNKCVRVSSPSLWVALAFTIIVLVLFVIWSFSATIEININGLTTEIHPISYILN